MRLGGMRWKQKHARGVVGACGATRRGGVWEVEWVAWVGTEWGGMGWDVVRWIGMLWVE